MHGCAYRRWDPVAVNWQGNGTDSSPGSGWCPPYQIVGKNDDALDRIKFQLSDCVFEYGDFRHVGAEDSGERRVKAFLVVASSKSDALSLFEPRN